MKIHMLLMSYNQIIKSIKGVVMDLTKSVKSLSSSISCQLMSPAHFTKVCLRKVIYSTIIKLVNPFLTAYSK